MATNATESDVELGDLKWGKVVGHPWWPCIVCNCPKRQTHVWETSGDKKVHVQFYSSPTTHAWIKVSYLRPFEGKDFPESQKGGMFYCTKKNLTSALERAHHAQLQTRQERLAECFVGQEDFSCQENSTTHFRKGKRERPKKQSLSESPRLSYNLKTDIIPNKWRTAFVLLQFFDPPKAVNLSGSALLSNENEDRDDDDLDEDLTDSDDDPEWGPSKSKTCKKDKELMCKKRKFGVKTDKVKQKKAHAPTTDALKAGTHKSTAAGLVKRKKARSPRIDAQITNTSASQESAGDRLKPEVGDFLVEREACQDGQVPFLWRYGSWNLMKKFVKVEEMGQTMYELGCMHLEFQPSESSRYDKVGVQTVIMLNNKERVTITKMPDWLKEKQPDITTVSQPLESDSDVEVTTASAQQNMQDQEVSSTTDDLFQVGKFVMDTMDRANVDNFPIWKIDSHMLIQKYKPEVVNGQLLHKPANSYRGYLGIPNTFLPIEVTQVSINDEEFVQVIENSRPKLDVNASREDNPLLEHLCIYLQALLCQAQNQDFLEAALKQETYRFSIGEINKLIKQKLINIERKVRWRREIQEALIQCPCLRTVNKQVDVLKCEALTGSRESVKYSAFLFGAEYNKETLKLSGSSHSCKEFGIGETANSHIFQYHQLCHFKYNLYDRCLAKVKMLQDVCTDQSKPNHEFILDKCLGNKEWVLQILEEFLQMVNMD